MAVVLEGVQSVPGGSAQLIRVEDVQNHWETLDRSAAIVFGSPTYMGRIAMDNPKMVFVGTHHFSLELSSTVEMDGPGFEVVCSFGTLEQLQAFDAPDFSHAPAVCVTDCAEVEEIHVVEKEEVVEEYDSPGWYYFLARVLPEAARWVLCFPVTRKQSGKYALRTHAVPPGGDDAFYTFASAVSSGAPVQAVPYLEDIRFLSPQSGDKLVVVRASDWSWDENENTVFIRSQDVIEMETISESEVRVL